MEWNEMVCKIRKLNGLEQYGMEWVGWFSQTWGKTFYSDMRLKKA